MAMFEAPLSEVIAIDTDTETIHFYLAGSGQKPNHLVANYRANPFDEAFFEKLGKILKSYQQKNPAAPLTKVSLVLPDHVFLSDTMNIPAIGKKAMENSLEVAISAIYKNKKELKYRTYPLAQNKQFATYGLVGMRKDLIARFTGVCEENQISVQNITFAANAAVNGAFTLNPKLKNGTFLLLDIKENASRFAFVNKGRTVGSYGLPFGYSMLYKTRLAAEDLLFDHASAELLVLNAKEKAKAKQLTIMGEEVLNDPDEQDLQERTEAASVFGEDEVLGAGISGEGKKAGRKLPKFMLRDTPSDREGFVYENFRIFMKWALDLIAGNPEITAQGAVGTVYVNLPGDFDFLYERINAEESENKVKFLPLVTGAGFDASAAGAKALELLGGLYVKQFNKINNF